MLARFVAWPLALSLLALAGTSSATLVPMNNADFELDFQVWDAGADELFSVGSIPGWNVLTLGGVFEPDLVSEVSFDASQAGTIGTRVAYSSGHLVAQGLAITYDASVLYTLSMDFGFRTGTQFFGIFGFYRPNNPFPAGVSTAGIVVAPEGEFVRQTLILDGGDLPTEWIGQTIILGFQAFAVLGNPSEIYVDNVTLDASAAPLPAPPPAWLVGISLAALTRRRRSSARP